MEEAEEDRFTVKYKHTDAEGESVLHSIKTIRLNQIKYALFVVLSVIFVGIPLLLVHW